MDRRGFTLVELLITLTVLAAVVVVLLTVMFSAQRSKIATANRIESAQGARAAIELMARDLRSAGYGADNEWPGQPQTPIAYVDSLQVLINANMEPFPDTSVLRQPPQSYDPGGNPRPFPLDGTSWEPPVKYRRGAELIRWTLDLDNDGDVDAGDRSDPDGQDAQQTPNPDDFVLVREVYGDSVGWMAGNNGPFTTDRIALVRAPGGTVPPLFRVYFQGNNEPYDWSLGPVPAARLEDIERIEVQVVSTSSKPDWRGRFADTPMRTEINSMRNSPTAGTKTYVIDGYVISDLNTDGDRDAGEPGLPAVTVRLGGGMSTVTNASGYFQFRVPAGSYVVRQDPPWGYGTLTNPDSFGVTVPPPASVLFCDTLAMGGWVHAFVYDDKDLTASYTGGDTPFKSVKLTLSPTGQVAYTDVNGRALLFAPAGSYSVTATAPDSFLCATPNPVGGTMADGDSASISFGMQKAEIGTVEGMVFRDNNRDGDADVGENGFQNIWVGVSKDGGVTVEGYAYTDASGNYSIDVPANDPPGTEPYYVMCIPPSGHFATTSTSLGPLLISPSEVSTGNNFGMANFQTITLNASRVLSLASGDLVEKDWNGNQTQNAHKDVDLVLGADAGGTDNVSVWFNDYDGNPLYPSDRTYARLAPQSVLALTLDTLDANDNKLRLDAVTGTRTDASGNFFVWFNQNSGGNEGYFPNSYSVAYRTQDNGDVQAVLSADVWGAATPDQVDILVGTKSPTAGRGTVEIWSSNNAAIPAFTRQDIYPTQGGVPGGIMGEVTAMAMADFDSPPDGRRDLVVATRTGNYSGELMFLKSNGKTGGAARFTHQVTYTRTDGAFTSLAVLDVNGDTRLDVVAGRQTGIGAGDLQYWRNGTSGVYSFSMDRELDADGIVLSLIAADMGGSSRKDVIAGWRQNETSYMGGIEIYSTDSGTLPPGGTDPSAGGVVNMVPALATNNFNYGVKPSTPPPPYLADFAAGVKIDATTGALLIFIR